MKAQITQAYLVCPHCQSDHLWVQQACDACGSLDLDHLPLTYHMACAHVFHKSESPSIEQCPQCGRSIQLHADEFENCGEILVCLDCQKQQAEARQFFLCKACHQPFDIDQAKLIKQYDTSAS